MKADERMQAEENESEVKDEVKVKDVNVQEGQNVSGAELMQIRVENIKSNQEKGAPCHPSILLKLRYFINIAMFLTLYLYPLA